MPFRSDYAANVLVQYFFPTPSSTLDAVRKPRNESGKADLVFGSYFGLRRCTFVRPAIRKPVVQHALPTLLSPRVTSGISMRREIPYILALSIGNEKI